MEVFTDDESQTDTVSVTYPRERQAKEETQPKDENQATKRVSFSETPRPAVSKAVTIAELEKILDALGVSKSSGTTGDASEDESDIDERKRRRASRRPKRICTKVCAAKLRIGSHGLDELDDCSCSECESELRKVALRLRKNRLKKELRIAKVQSQSESSTPSDQTTDEEANKSPRATKSVKKSQASASSCPNSSTSDTTSELYTSTDAEPPSRKKKRRTPSQKTSKKTVGKDKKLKSAASENEDDKKKSTADGTSKGAPGEQKTQHVNSMAVSTNKFKTNPVPHPDLVKPNLLSPIEAKLLHVEHAVEEPEDPRPNSFYDVESGTVRVYHGPVYGNPTGTMYPIRAKRGPGLTVGVPHPLSNAYYEAGRLQNMWPAGPSMPYWAPHPGSLPYPGPLTGPMPQPGLVGAPQVPYYCPVGVETVPRHVSSGSVKGINPNDEQAPRRSGHTQHHSSQQNSGRHRSSKSRGSPADSRRNHAKQTTNSGRRENSGLDSNNSAANLFNDGNGDGWGRAVWNNLPQLGKNETWGSKNGSDNWMNNWGKGNDSGNSNGGNNGNSPAAGSVNNNWGGSNNNAGDYWAGGGSGSQNLEQNNATNNDNSRHSSEHGTYPQDSNVCPPDFLHPSSSGHAHGHRHTPAPSEMDINGVFDGQQTHAGFRGMPGAWEEQQRGQTWGNPDQAKGDDIPPSWADPTAAQSSNDPPAWAKIDTSNGKGGNDYSATVW